MSGNSKQNPTRIFLIEDHAHFRKLLGMCIDLTGEIITCGSAASGREALSGIPNASPDLVLIDYSMPQMNGIETLDQIRNNWPEIKCFILSGHSEEHYVAEARKHGAAGFILKSRPNEIIENIRQAIQSEEFFKSDLNKW